MELNTKKSFCFWSFLFMFFDQIQPCLKICINGFHFLFYKVYEKKLVGILTNDLYLTLNKGTEKHRNDSLVDVFKTKHYCS